MQFYSWFLFISFIRIFILLSRQVSKPISTCCQIQFYLTITLCNYRIVVQKLKKTRLGMNIFKNKTQIQFIVWLPFIQHICANSCHWTEKICTLIRDYSTTIVAKQSITCHHFGYPQFLKMINGFAFTKFLFRLHMCSFKAFLHLSYG